MALVRCIHLNPLRVGLVGESAQLVMLLGARELGMTTAALAGQLHLAQPAVSQSALRGRKIALAEKLKLL